MKLPFGFHGQNEGPDTQRNMLDKLEMTSVKFILDADCINDPEKMALYVLAYAKGCLLVGRRWHDVDPDLDAPDMILEARRYFDGWGETQSFARLAQIFPMFQVWEGPNEIGITDPARMQKYADFCNEFARLMATVANRRAGIGSWAVGTPDIGLWGYWRAALDAVKKYRAILTRHSYGPIELNKDLADGGEGTWYAFRHRRDLAAFAEMGYPESETPMLITECGTDNLDKAKTFNRPWRELWGWKDDAILKYWLEWGRPFVSEISKDSYVLGAHLFTVGNGGNGGWNKFDVAHLPLADIILQHPPTLAVPSPITVTPPPIYSDPTPILPVTPVPVWATHQVIPTALNVRLFPWTQDVEPSIVGQLLKDKFVRVTNIVKGPGQSTGWYHVGADMWVNGTYLKEIPQAPVVVVPHPVVTPEPVAPPVYVSRGVVGIAFSTEKAQISVGEKLWFNFEVQNQSSLDVAYAILAARTVEGQCAKSWTNEHLAPWQGMVWRDWMSFSQPGTYHVYLGIGYDDKEACIAMRAPWYRLSPDVVVVVR